MVNVLGLYGSPRKGGNTDILLDRTLEGAAAAGAQTKKCYVRRLQLSGCIECGGCDDTGECVVHDDMDQVYPLLLEAEIVFLASPIFFYGVTAQIKALIDRAQALWNRRRLRKAPEALQRFDSGDGYLIAVGATKGANLFEGAVLTARYFFDALDKRYHDGLLVPLVEARGEIRRHPEILDRAFVLGQEAVHRYLHARVRK